MKKIDVYRYDYNDHHDTVIGISGEHIMCLFYPGDNEPREYFMFTGSVPDLLRATDKFFDEGVDTIKYEDLSIPAQDAIYNALSDIAKKEEV